MKRQRGRGRKPPHQQGNRAFESNGPDVKIRGNAAHIFEKYVQLARDANSSGDRVLAENYLQHAEHYFRILRAQQPSYGQNRTEFQHGQPFDRMSLAYAGEDEDGEDAGEEGEEHDAETQADMSAGHAPSREPQQREQQPRREDYRRDERDFRNRDRDNRERGREFRGERSYREDRGQRDDRDWRNRDRDYRGARDDRPRDDRPRDERPRDERPRDERPRDERSREDRPREDRPREDRPREDRTREDRLRDERSRDERSRDDRAREERGYREDRAAERSGERYERDPRGEIADPRSDLPQFLRNPAPLRPAIIDEEPGDAEIAEIAALDDTEPGEEAPRRGRRRRTRFRASETGAPERDPGRGADETPNDAS
jgi:hypothetical protein